MAARTISTIGLAAVALLAWLPSPVASETYLVQEYAWYKDYAPQPEHYCFYGCYAVVGYMSFNYTPVGTEDDYYLNECSNTLKIQSMFGCAQKYCTLGQAKAGRDLLNPDCAAVGLPLPTIEEGFVSEDDLNQIVVLNETAGLASFDVPLNAPAIPDPDWYYLGWRSVKEFYFTWDLGFNFAFGVIAFWAFVLTVGMVHRAITFMNKSREGPQAGWWLWIRKNLILPATFGKHQSEAIAHTYTIPPRLESIILTVYVVMNFIMCFPGYHLFAGNLYYSTNKLQLARYIADRTGFLSIAQLPMVWVFAARNDPFMWLTGWSFATYNRFHRWIARTSVVHAIMHSIGYTLFEFYEEPTGAATYYNAAWLEEYWYCGGIATVVMSLMLVASAYYFRERYYDLFLMVHISMSLIFFVVLWYHVRIFNGEFNYFLYPCIAMWALDRLLRLGRTVFVSVMPRFMKGVKATATYHRTTEMVRLDITDFFPTKPIVPGLYYYLYMPAGLRGYESHPFTMCSWRRTDDSEPSSPARSMTDKEIEPNVRQATSDYTSGSIAHTFLIRPYRGMTGRLQKKLLASDESISSAQTTVFLEGPYGEKLDLSGYSDVLVVCGGSGITAAISHSHFLMSENSHTKVHIAWAVPQRHLPDDICANELASVIHNDRVNMIVYLTSAAEEEAHDPEKLPAQPLYKIRLGRPDIEAVMREHRQLAKKSLAIVTCGTPQMSDVCRAAVVKVLGEEGVEVGYYNETLVW